MKTSILCGQGYIVAVFDWCTRADEALSILSEEKETLCNTSGASVQV